MKFFRAAVAGVFISCLIAFTATFLFAQQDVVAKYRSQYPTPMGADNALKCLKQIASEVKGGILVKTSGSNCNGYACDIICFPNGDHYDVFGDAEGAGRPQWDYVGKIDPSRCEMQSGPIEPPKPPSDNFQKTLLEKLDRIIDLLQAIRDK